MKYVSFFLLFFVSFSLFFGCDDTQMVIDPVLSSLETGEFSQISEYNGLLHRVGSVEKFGLNVEDPVALEWDGVEFYMLAEQGRSKYLFRVDRETSVASMVNRGASDFGGTFDQGRSFTKVFGVSPSDLAWRADTGEMLAVCPVIDSIVGMDIESGVAIRINREDDYCLLNEDGYPRIGSGVALGYDGITFYMAGITRFSNEDGREPLSELYRISGNLRCATRVGSAIQFDVGEYSPTSMCFDGENMWMAGSVTKSLYVLDLETGRAIFVAEWRYAVLPLGHYIQDKNTGLDSGLVEMPLDHDGRNYSYVNISENIGFDFPDITGIAFDGQDMYAVDSFTDALYRVGRN